MQSEKKKKKTWKSNKNIVQSILTAFAYQPLFLFWTVQSTK